MQSKKCSKCGEIKSVEAFNKNKSSKDGLHHYCKSCRMTGRAAYILANPGRIKAYNAAYYVTNKEKSDAVASAYRSLNKENIMAMQAVYRAANKEKIAAFQFAYYVANKDKRLAYVAAWQKENPEKCSAANAKWAAANQERKKTINKAWLTVNLDRRRISNAAWRIENQDTIRAYKQNRRARKLAAGGKLSAGLFFKLFKLQRGKCACCRVDLTKAKPHMDHIIALVNGGPNVDSNIQLLCQPCNNQKHVKDPIAFMQSKGFLL